MIWYLLLNKSKGFEWWVSLLFFVLNDNKLSSHMAQISEHTNSPIQKKYSYDQMIKMIVNLGSKTGENNYNSSPQLTHLHNSILMSIIDTPEKDLSNVDRISDMRKVLTSSVKPSSTFFSC